MVVIFPLIAISLLALKFTISLPFWINWAQFYCLWMISKFGNSLIVAYSGTHDSLVPGGVCRMEMD